MATCLFISTVEKIFKGTDDGELNEGLSEKFSFPKFGSFAFEVSGEIPTNYFNQINIKRQHKQETCSGAQTKDVSHSGIQVDYESFQFIRIYDEKYL